MAGSVGKYKEALGKLIGLYAIKNAELFTPHFLLLDIITLIDENFSR